MNGPAVSPSYAYRVPEHVAFDFDQKVMDGIERAHKSTYVSDDGEMSELSDSESDLEVPPHLNPSGRIEGPPYLSASSSSNIFPASTGNHPTTTGWAAKRKARNSESARKCKKKKKARLAENPTLIKKQVDHSREHTLSFEAESFGIASTGYIGQRKDPKSTRQQVNSLDEVLEYGFTLMKWDGTLVFFKKYSK